MFRTTSLVLSYELLILLALAPVIRLSGAMLSRYVEAMPDLVHPKSLGIHTTMFPHPLPHKCIVPTVAEEASWETRGHRSHVKAGNELALLWPDKFERMLT